MGTSIVPGFTGVGLALESGLMGLGHWFVYVHLDPGPIGATGVGLMSWSAGVSRESGFTGAGHEAGPQGPAWC